MGKIDVTIDEESLAGNVISALKQCIDGEMTPEKICLFLNVQPIYHESKKILYNKLIFSQYHSGENLIHIYIGSIREHFGNSFYSQVIKALYHEIFHFLWAKRKEYFPFLFIRNASQIKDVWDRYMRSLQKMNFELTANIFAEKLSKCLCNTRFIS